MEEDMSHMNAMRFPQKLWYMLNMGTNAIMWGHTKRTILLNYRILHGYLQCDQSIFKTANISSFVRQLNLYGFRKVTSHLQDPLCNSSNPYMHEYAHDYFQIGRPDLLNKITRKTFTIRRHHKPKNVLLTNSNASQPELYVSPLHKARQALQTALRKAAQDLKIADCFDFKFDNDMSLEENMEYNMDDNLEDTMEDHSKEEHKEHVLDWITGSDNKENIPPLQHQPEMNETIISPDCDPPGLSDGTENYRNSCQSQDAFINFNMTSETGQPTAGYSGPTLSMPDLDTEEADNSNMELLAEFNIDQEIDQGITRKIGDKSYQSSLNCVLPSIGVEPIDDVTMAQRAAEDCASNHYNDGEWDLMLNDIIANRGSGSEGSSDLKELYSQISRTIDMLNC